MSTAKHVSELMNALYQRDQSRIEELLAGDPELSSFERAALGRALDPPTSGALKDRSADGFSCLHLACFFGHVDSARTLITHGADVNAPADNPSQVQPLHSAAAARSVAIVSLLLEHGAQPNARQHGGWTALHAACMHADEPMVRTLLEHGADLDQAADDGQTARSMAADKPNLLPA
ncbi:MAG: ankyrin repeat protein [Planctomycetota bacterium]|jgi:ankyrin repeat protein